MLVDVMLFGDGFYPVTEINARLDSICYSDKAPRVCSRSSARMRAI